MEYKVCKEMCRHEWMKGEEGIEFWSQIIIVGDAVGVWGWSSAQSHCGREC